MKSFYVFLVPAFFALCLADTASRIIRFKDEQGNTLVGQPLKGAVLRAQLVEPSTWQLTEKVVKVHSLLAPVAQPPVILGIGLNYWGHINATHLKPPKTPSVFSKFKHSYNHPNYPVVIPSFSSKPDYEGELAIVFGKTCKDVSEEDALSCVSGYTICHDVSARCYQSDKDPSCPGNGGQFSFSKGLDTHAPLGPALVPKAALGDASNLRLTTRVNGELRQNVSTSELIYGVKKIVSFVTMATTVDAGTVICSGTPDGVGDTMKPPTYLKNGDVVEIQIEKIGTLKNHIARPNNTAEYRAVKMAPAATALTENLSDYLW